MNKDLLSVKEVSEMLGVARSTIRRWDDEGRLKPIRTLGGHRRYERSVIEKLLEYPKED